MQEPWAEEGLGSYQIMTAVQQQGYRPVLPPLDQLPGQVGQWGIVVKQWR